MDDEDRAINESKAQWLGRESPVINVSYKKKGILGIFLAAVIVAGIIGAHQLKAAERVDTKETVTISAMVDTSDDSVFANEYQGVVEVELYKVATLSGTAEASLTSTFADSGINLGVLKQNPNVDTIKTEIVNKAIDKVKDENLTPDKMITLDRSQGAIKAGVDFEEGAGLYLYIPKEAQDDRYTYTFTPYVIFAPTSDYISSNGQLESDKWNYQPVFALKSEAKPRFGDLLIKKNLENFNESLNGQSFIYKVKAVLDDDPDDDIEGEVVLDNVYPINFNSAGEATELIEHIPATAVVTVVEDYSGSSYKPVEGTSATAEVTIIGNKTNIVEFKNTYNGGNVSGGIAAKNEFKIEEGVIYWIDENGDKVRQTELIREAR